MAEKALRQNRHRISLAALLAAVSLVALWLGWSIAANKVIDEMRRAQIAADAAKAEPLYPKQP